MRFVLSIMTLMVFNISCSRDIGSSAKVRIQVPKMSSAKMMSSEIEFQNKGLSTFNAATAGGLRFSSTIVETDINLINCYMVFVNGPEALMSDSTCTNAVDDDGFAVGVWAGAIYQGGVLDLEVPSGAGREIILAGFRATSAAACTDLYFNTPDTATLTNPYIISKRIIDLPPGDVSVNMLAILDSNSMEVSSCSGPAFDFLGGGGSDAVIGGFFDSIGVVSQGTLDDAFGSEVLIEDFDNDGLYEFIVGAPGSDSVYIYTEDDMINPRCTILGNANTGFGKALAVDDVDAGRVMIFDPLIAVADGDINGILFLDGYTAALKKGSSISSFNDYVLVGGDGEAEYYHYLP